MLIQMEFKQIHPGILVMLIALISVNKGELSSFNGEGQFNSILLRRLLLQMESNKADFKY